MMTYIRQAWLVLLLGLLFGAALAGVNDWLGPKIETNERNARLDAAARVFAPAGAAEAQIRAFVKSVTVKPVKIKVDGKDVDVYRVSGEGDKPLGWAVPGSGQGYGDVIKLIIGVTPDRKQITDFKVIYNLETPGLGNRIVEGGFRKRFRGKDPAAQITAVNSTTPADNEIQALTGATISSQAVCDIIYSQLSKSGLLTALARYEDDVKSTDTEN